MTFPRQEVVIDGTKVVLESSEVLESMSKSRLKAYARKVQTDIYKYEWLIKSQSWAEDRAPMPTLKAWLSATFEILNAK